MLDSKRLDSLTESIRKLRDKVLAGHQNTGDQLAQLEAAEKEMTFIRETVKVDVPTVEASLDERLTKLEHDLIDLQNEMTNPASTSPQPPAKKK